MVECVERGSMNKMLQSHLSYGLRLSQLWTRLLLPSAGLRCPVA
jgi:hypothetical protein